MIPKPFRTIGQNAPARVSDQTKAIRDAADDLLAEIDGLISGDNGTSAQDRASNSPVKLNLHPSISGGTKNAGVAPEATPVSASATAAAR